MIGGMSTDEKTPLIEAKYKATSDVTYADVAPLTGCRSKSGLVAQLLYMIIILSDLITTTAEVSQYYFLTDPFSLQPSHDSGQFIDVSIPFSQIWMAWVVCVGVSWCIFIYQICLTMYSFIRALSADLEGKTEKCADLESLHQVLITSVGLFMTTTLGAVFVNFAYDYKQTFLLHTKISILSVCFTVIACTTQYLITWRRTLSYYNKAQESSSGSSGRSSDCSCLHHVALTVLISCSVAFAVFKFDMILDFFGPLHSFNNNTIFKRITLILPGSLFLWSGFSLGWPDCYRVVTG